MPIRMIYGLERIAAASGLVILAPALVGIALAIGLLSKRSPLVSHTRVGLGGAPLHMLKFRTMWEIDNYRGPFFAIENVDGVVPALKGPTDPRINSRFAAFCRCHSLDELPQLFHVARGEMSLVGPRPITRREHQLHYAGCMDEVLSLRPGITGLWQVLGRNRLTYARRRRLDLLFVRRLSAGLYLRIMLRSVPRVIRGTGAC
ncbi:MAG: sugar transferase [Acidobacteriota bacterium]|nr:sugar transferase [Acidobacteriota bacterium]